MKIKNRSRIIVFIFSFVIWLALTGINSYQEILAGLFFAVLVSLIAGHLLITTEKKANIFRRIYFFCIYIVIFIWEMIKANFHVAWLVLHPMKPIRPGIVKIKTSLSNDSAITMLCNSITLTPGTLTVDLNKEKQEIYIHWIDVKSISVEGATQNIADRFEKVLKEIFE